MTPRLKPGAFRLSPRAHQFYGRFTDGQSPDVQGGVLVGMGLVATCLAGEFGLVLSVGLLAMLTLVTGSAGVPRIDVDHVNTGQSRLVIDERTELPEAPTAESIVSVPAPSLDPIANPFEFFKSDPATGAFGGLNDYLADDVILMLAESSLCLSDPLQLLFRSLGVPFLEPFPLEIVLATDVIDGLPRVLIPVAVRSDVSYSKVNPDEVRGRRLGSIGNVYRDEQEPLAVLAADQIGLPLGPAEPLGLVLSHDERHNDPTIQRTDADPIRPLESDVLTHRVRDSGVLTKLGLACLVSLVGFDDLPQTADRHIRRNAELFAEFLVGDLLEFELVRALMLERHASQPRCRRVESLDRFSQAGSVLRVGQQLNLEREFHADIIVGTFPPNKREFTRFLPTPEGGGSLASLGGTNQAELRLLVC
jgi:hypothetical protein